MTTPKQTPVSSGELMIGNWIQNQYGMTMQVHTINTMEIKGKASEQVTNLCIWNKDISGIPLTPDILEKCGFEKRTIDRYVFHELRVADLVFNFSEDKLHFGVQGFANVEWIEYKLTFVHQLQNLYHALTGSHLKVEI